jgi:hypothetical protein
MYVQSFFENVERDGRKAVAHFVPRDGREMIIACLYSDWGDPETNGFLSLAVPGWRELRRPPTHFGYSFATVLRARAARCLKSILMTASPQSSSGKSVKVSSGLDECTQQSRTIVQARSDHVKDIVLAL